MSGLNLCHREAVLAPPQLLVLLQVGPGEGSDGALALDPDHFCLRHELISLFHPSVQPYLRSYLTTDPAELIAKVECPTLILHWLSRGVGESGLWDAFYLAEELAPQKSAKTRYLVGPLQLSGLRDLGLDFRL